MSYLFDIYRGEMQPQRNLPRLSLYICLFPQLIAGPIIRYKEIGGQLNARRAIQLRDVSVGLTRFVQGLAKKVLCANILGSFVDQVFALPMNERSVSAAWLAMLAYGLQIYFDFSGYSDMAIGLARVFGFLFPENFSHPYIAESVQEFWRRWHMSLSRWFRDYLYVPLGGNQKGTARTALNLALVFFLCGLWHGASWSFIVWGLMHGTMLALERIPAFATTIKRLPRVMRHAYVLGFVFLAWIPFRAANLQKAWEYARTLFGVELNRAAPQLSSLVNPATWLVLLAAILLCMPLRQRATAALQQKQGFALSWMRPALVASLLVACMIRLAAGAYNPFIYFRF